ncbi:MAG: hypothetical protein ACI30O_08880, partial [Muribaculaceae bacterium]
ITDRHKGILYLAQSTLSARRSFVKLSQRKLFIARFEEFAEENRLGDFMIRKIYISRRVR